MISRALKLTTKFTLNKPSYLSMIDISQVVESTSLTDSIPMLLAYFKVTATANDSLFELAHDLQSVAEVSRGLSLAQPVTHSPGQSKVVLVVLPRKIRCKF